MNEPIIFEVPGEPQGKRRARLFTKEENERLKRSYLEYKRRGKLAELAQEMQRTKQFICRKARSLGLTDRKRKAAWNAFWKYMPEDQTRPWMDKFKKSSLGLGRFCRKNKIAELGFYRTMKRCFPDEYEHVIESKTPISTKYRRGRQFEYRVRDDLQKKGFFVLRSPASRSPIDLAAIKRGLILLVQCKMGSELPRKEWNKLFELAEETGALPILAGRLGFRELQYFRLMDKKDDSRKRQPRLEIKLFEKAYSTRPHVEVEVNGQGIFRESSRRKTTAPPRESRAK